MAAAEPYVGLDREVRLVEGAVALVGSGASRATTVGGIAFGEEVLRLVGPAARRAGVGLDPLWLPGRPGCDIRITRRGR